MSNLPKTSLLWPLTARIRMDVGNQPANAIGLGFYAPSLAPHAAMYGIKSTVVEAPEARNLQQGTLVISAMALMRPEWAWLRKQHQPIDRVGYTPFVYRIGD